MNAVIVERLERSFRQDREAAGVSDIAGAFRSALSMQADTVLAHIEGIAEALRTSRDTEVALAALARLEAAMKPYAGGDEQWRQRALKLERTERANASPSPSDEVPFGYSAEQMAEAMRQRSASTEQRNKPGRRPKRPFIGPIE